jgi:hypothetical protein
MIASFRARVVMGRIVLEVDGQPPLVIARVVQCPCCGAKTIGGESWRS